MAAYGTKLTAHGTELTAEAVMSIPTVVDASSPLTLLWDVMQRLHLDLVVACDHRGPLGVVDRQDIWTAWASNLGSSPLSTGRCAVTATPCVSPDTTLPEVCRALLAAHHETVMVLDEDGTLRGVVTPADLRKDPTSKVAG